MLRSASASNRSKDLVTVEYEIAGKNDPFARQAGITHKQGKPVGGYGCYGGDDALRHSKHDIAICL